MAKEAHALPCKKEHKSQAVHNLAHRFLVQTASMRHVCRAKDRQAAGELTVGLVHKHDREA